MGSTVLAGALLYGAAPAALADATRDAQWPLQSFEAERIWQQSTGKGVTVAVIDGPVRTDHPDLAGNVLTGNSFHPGDDEEDGDHGTGMAAIIAGHGHGPGHADGVKGLAPDAEILPLAKPEDDGPSIGARIRQAVDAHAGVINISLGVDYLSSSDEEAIAYAFEKDVIIVAGTGNDATRPTTLSTHPGVVGVGAVGQDGMVWEDSNFGPGVMLTAPGVHIKSAGATKSYRQASGTSDSAAYVSGAAALLRAKFPDLTAGQIVNRLVKTAGMAPSNQNLSLPDPHYGHGFIRPLRALTADLPAGPANGPLKVPEDPYADVRADAAKKAAEPKAKGPDSLLIIGIATAGGFAVLGALGAVLAANKRKRQRQAAQSAVPGGFGGPNGPGGPGGWPRQGVPPQYGAPQPPPGAPGPYAPQQPPAPYPPQGQTPYPPQAQPAYPPQQPSAGPPGA
ncbi:S8 family serine peptidase [Streptomyces chrestomyceticus]|uniref:S8 family serine peptidase n=1 Tax=Streptomyces chrestomyceticus TaxID=68185 RepID=UPI0027DC38E0|nr:S8 family serine peptidase [Streptomyces chrestomyceticus]